METKICLECGKEFEKDVDFSFKYWSKRKFCSRSCYRKNFDRTRTKHICDYCGKEFFISPYKLKRNINWKNYCSVNCRKKSAFTIGCGLTFDGYVWIYAEKKQIKVHRYLMELKLNRKILSSEIVHHKDFNKLNNDIDNLEIVTRTEHNKTHKFLTKK